MRVLFAAVPAVGHLFPLVPLAWACRAAGHEVLVASLDGAEIITGAGLPLVNVHPGLAMYDEVLGRAGGARPDLLARTRASAGADRDAFARLFAMFNARVADDFSALAEEWRPDLVVHEYLCPAAAVAAGRTGTPAVQLGIGFSPFPALRAAMAEELSGLLPDGPFAALHTVPPSMAGPGAAGEAVRPVPYDGGRALPGWLRRRPAHPRVAVTLGTVSPVMSGLDRVRRVVAAVAGLDVEVVLATGDTDLGPLGTLPPNVVAPGWVPWSALLSTSDAAIHHGGSGTTLAALAAGVPQLLLPDGSDRHLNADAVVARGAGCRAAADEITPGLITALLADEDVHVAAGEVAREIAAMPSPAGFAAGLDRRT
ncbi:UDP:flavonoid glycosyltransferase YjiC (YdhE family) [Saccharothrix australiensis]|uniref:UDP:flavonoid glycosyltransferase YjiC (YdhE family) n=2 Tax=Saccharothrix australiensis TaxID=2072 RepID=A0A495W770_9PSEU|nr:UDP:flavonoid glycosyltransferase YjiC (YdhE family) [Saccharothrix australiensis]